MKVKIEIDTRTFVRFWLVVIAFGLAGLMIYSARTALLIIGIAFFLALALNGPVARLAAVMPGKSRLGGTALAFISIIVLLGTLIWFVVPPLVEQSAKFAETIPSLVDEANEQWVGLRDFIDHNNLRPQVDSALDNIKDSAATWAASAGSNIISGVGSLTSFLISTFLVIVLAFLMLLEGPMWMSRLWSLYRDKKKMEHHRQVVGRMHSVVSGYVTGQLTISSIGALAAGACVFVLSLIFPEVPGNLAMPTILLTFILTLIPMFGSTLAGAAVGLLILFNSVTAGIIYGVYFILYQQIENNFIQPTVQAKRLDLSALVVLVAVTIGVYVSGVVGGIVAVPIAGVIKVLIEEYLKSRKSEQVENDSLSQKIIKKLRPSEKKS